MEAQNIFVYNYNAKENQEVLAIREKYLPKKESKLEELKRLDATVQGAGMVEALSVGVCSALTLGVGMCLGMQVLGSGIVTMAIGVLIGIVGIAGMLAAYPVYCKIFSKTKEKLTPRILELSAELSGSDH